MQYGPLVISLKDKYLHSLEKEILKHRLIGGVFLFSENFESKNQVLNLVEEIKKIAAACNKKIIVMTDHEGGFVQPFTNGLSSIPAARRLGDIYDIDRNCALMFAKRMGELVACELKTCGVDILLGPVIDLDKGNSVISGLDRAFHSDLTIVTELAEAYIIGLKNKGMNATLKHFPGHGVDIGDTHSIQPIDNRTLNEILETDLTPFSTLVNNKAVGAVMSAHIVYPKIDQDVVTYSKVWLKDILRTKLGFNGVIISDSLSMIGAGKENSLTKIKLALELSDIVLFCDQKPEDYIKLLESLDSENIKLSDESVMRIEKWLNVEETSLSNHVDDTAIA